MVIPKEQLKQYQRWQLADFDAPAQPETVPMTIDASLADTSFSEEQAPPPSAPLPTAEELEQLYEAARAEGYQAGWVSGEEAGKQAMESELAAQATQLNALVENFRRALSTADQAVADQLLDLSIEIAEQVVRSKLKLHRDAILPVVREAIGALPIHHAHILLHIHPDDYQTVKNALGESYFQAGNQLVEDPNIHPGGCILNAGASEIDATIETRWKRILEPLGASANEWLKN